MKSKAALLFTARSTGFAIGELLLAVAMMGLAVGLLVPLFSLKNDFRSQRAQSAALQIVAFFETARAGGVNFFDNDGALPTVVRMTLGNAQAQSPQYPASPRFQLLGFSAEQIEAALPYLAVSKGSLCYASPADGKPAAPLFMP
jgi:type II secretory pathway pseudopilin PulG